MTEDHAHHTSEEVKRAFAYAPEVLRQLEQAGVQLASLELYADASGKLWLPDNMTPAQVELAMDLVMSQRPVWRYGAVVGIAFCCGLVERAKHPLVKQLGSDLRVKS